MVRFIPHALSRLTQRGLTQRGLTQRGITQENIAHALANPIETIQAKRNRTAVYSQINDRYILVIFEKLNNEELVITAMWSEIRRLRRFGFTRI
jgi:hypothetical protein